MKKTNYEKYQEFVLSKIEELSKAPLLQWMDDYTKLTLLYNRVIIDLYNKFLREKWEERK